MTRKPTRIQNWSVASNADRYTPPEFVTLFLLGNVYGHPHKADGKCLRTSAIQSVRGRIVKTCNTTYRLGQPCKDFIAFLRANRLRLPTGRKPIRVRRNG